MTDPTMKKTAGDGVELALAVWGGKGKTVLCVHGISGSCRCWDNLAEALSPQHQVLSLDPRGRGLSEKPASGYSVSYHCRDIHALLNHENIDQVVSWGIPWVRSSGWNSPQNFRKQWNDSSWWMGAGNSPLNKEKKYLPGYSRPWIGSARLFPSNEAYRIMTDKKEHLARVMTEEQGKPLKAVVRGLLIIWKRNWAAFLCKK